MTKRTLGWPATVNKRERPHTSPSGSTDATKEREQKFDEEGGDQPQARSEEEVDNELVKSREPGKRMSSMNLLVHTVNRWCAAFRSVRLDRRTGDQADAQVA